jgi:hypothetical protein
MKGDHVLWTSSFIMELLRDSTLIIGKHFLPCSMSLSVAEIAAGKNIGPQVK